MWNVVTVSAIASILTNYRSGLKSLLRPWRARTSRRFYPASMLPVPLLVLLLALLLPVLLLRLLLRRLPRRLLKSLTTTWASVYSTDSLRTKHITLIRRVSNNSRALKFWLCAASKTAVLVAERRIAPHYCNYCNWCADLSRIGQEWQEQNVRTILAFPANRQVICR